MRGAETIRKHLIIYCLIAICCLIEAGLQLGGLEFIGFSRLRQSAYEYGGFWPGLLGGWRPNYAAQPYAMFLTYSLLHGGLGHLAANMITLWSFGRPVLDRVGPRGFLLLYAGSSFGGGIGFALLAPDLRPVLKALRVPVLVLLGRQSAEPSVEALWAGPTTTVQWIEAGHAIYRHPEAVRATVDAVSRSRRDPPRR